MLCTLDLRSTWLGSSIPLRNCSRVSKRYLHETPKRLVVVAETATLEPAITEKSGGPRGLTSSKRVVLVRHGQSTWNESGRIQGSSDFSRLTPKGETQAETSRQMLLGDSFDVCYHSPLARAHRTAEIIWGSRQKQMIPLDDLREIDLYSFQGLFKEQGMELFGEAYRMWQKDPVNFVIDDHYPVRELWERAEKCWDVILSSKGTSVLVVAHNAVNQALVATATGLGSHYFRQLLQSNCGVSVLDFTPGEGKDGRPHTRVDRLNQTPGPPLLKGAPGKKPCVRILLVCHGATDSSFKKRFSKSNTESMNMLGIIQSGKTAEMLLDIPLDSLISSPQPCALDTAAAIAQVQEAAECLGGDCIPRYLEVIEFPELRDLNWGAWHGMPIEEVSPGRWEDYLLNNSISGGETLDEFWTRAGQAWQKLLHHLRDLETEPGGDKTVVVVGHSVLHAAMLCHCLGLDHTYFASFHLDTSSLSVVDFPNGPLEKGVVRCLNYTAHLGRWAVPVTRPSSGDEDF